MRNCPTKKLICNYIDEIWIIDLAEMIDYKISNNKIFRYIFVNIENFSKFVWAILLKIKKSQTKTEDFSNILKSSKRKTIKVESDLGKEW